MSSHNIYENDLAKFMKLKKVFNAIIDDIIPDISGGISNIILWYLEPYVVRSMPYIDEFRNIDSIGRQFSKFLPGLAVKSICEFAYPNIMMSPPIPCTLTTNGTIKNFNFTPDELISNVKVKLPYIESIGNIAGWLIAEGAPDPRNKKKSKKQLMKMAKSSKSKSRSNNLFGTAQTTFRVKTKFRRNDKVFAVKVFQAMKIKFCEFTDNVIIHSKQYPKFDMEIAQRLDSGSQLLRQWAESNVILETLGGLYVNCKDTKDVNNIVVNEIARALNRPDIKLSNFRATMRNYSKFSVTKSRQVDLQTAFDLLKTYKSDIFNNIRPRFNANKAPALNIEIIVLNHTSKKKTITIKIFQSGKIEIDSIVFYSHMINAYKFINKFIHDNRDDVLYTPITKHEYDSDYYYDNYNILAAPLELRL